MYIYLQMLVIEVFKTENDINPSYMKSIFTLKVNPRIIIRPNKNFGRTPFQI